MTANTPRSPRVAAYGIPCPYCRTPHALAVASLPGEHAAIRTGPLSRVRAHAASRRLVRTLQSPFRPRWQARFTPTTGLLRARSRAWLVSRAAYLELSS